MTKPTLYASFDVETDGPSPIVNNLLSIGIYFLDVEGQKVSQYYCNYKCLSGHVEDVNTMHFWEKNHYMFEKTRTNQQNLISAMYELSEQLKKLSEIYNIKFVAMPACFDWMFFKSYYEYAKKENNLITYDIGYFCTCMSSEFTEYCRVKSISKTLGQKMLHKLYNIDPNQEHYALYDAMAQGIKYVKFLKLK